MKQKSSLFNISIYFLSRSVSFSGTFLNFSTKIKIIFSLKSALGFNKILLFCVKNKFFLPSSSSSGLASGFWLAASGLGSVAVEAVEAVAAGGAVLVGSDGGCGAAAAGSSGLDSSGFGGCSASTAAVAVASGEGVGGLDAAASFSVSGLGSGGGSPPSTAAGSALASSVLVVGCSSSVSCQIKKET